MRRVLVGALAAVGVLSVIVNGTGPAGAEPSSETAAKFDTFSIEAQSQAGTGIFYAVGDEENRIAGAKAFVDKPENVVTLAAFFQRGTAAGYTYGATIGGGENSGAGGSGIAPEPPPGEANGQYPNTPGESTFKGPISTGAGGQVVDVQAHAKATPAPSGEADFAFQNIDAPGTLHIEHGVVTSRGEPVADGLEADSKSVLRGITIAKVLSIDSMISHAYTLLPADGGAPKTLGFSVLHGAAVNGTPVAITSGGVKVADQTQGAEQKAQLDKQVGEALKAAHIEDIRLVESTTKVSDKGVIKVVAGMLVVKYRDNAMAGSNPQGFGGGGFEVGGASIAIEAVRADAGSTALAQTAPPAESSSPATVAPVPVMATGTVPAALTERRFLASRLERRPCVL